MDVDTLTQTETMLAVVVAMAIGWGLVLEAAQKRIFEALPSMEWWSRATKPTVQMMCNFGFPKVPNDQFPNAVTEPMARDFYAFLTTLCFQHFLSALPMVPVLISGWKDASEFSRCLFVLGTLSDVGFDVYDAIKSTLRTFTKHSQPLPLDFWIVIVAMHHTLALSLVLPMNQKYIHLVAYQQTVVSLLLAASICYAAGNYKFTLEVTKPSGFYQYKLVVLAQLGTILYTRVYLWYPAIYVVLSHLKNENDTIFFYGGCFMGFVFSVFNLLLVADSLKAAAEWLPRAMPKNEKEAEDLPIHDGYGAAPSAAFELIAKMRRRRLKGAVRSVMAMNRMKKMSSKAD